MLFRTSPSPLLGGHRLLVAALVVALAVLPVLARKMDVGGHRLHFRDRGKGPVTVVFDAGFGSTADTWNWVVPEVTPFARTLVYDRAGMGRSDEGPLPRTSRRIASELNDLLCAASVPGPYVLVGHSLGGINLQQYAIDFPDQVAAIVLVDVTPLDFPENEPKLRSAHERRKFATALGVAPPAWRHEYEAVATSVRELRASGPLPDVPIIQLSSGRPDDTAGFRTAWRAMQRAMSTRLGVVRHDVLEESGHNIQYDDPQRVVEAIREAVRLAAESSAGLDTRRRGRGRPSSAR